MEAFYWLFNMSVVASVMGFIVVGIRKLRIIPRRVAIWLWVVPFFRMVFFVGVRFRFSLLTLVSRITTRTIPSASLTRHFTLSYCNTIMLADSYQPVSFLSNRVKMVFTAAAWIWIVGVGVFLTVLFGIYAVAMKDAKEADWLHDNVFLSRKVYCPVVYGIFHPRILLPLECVGRENKYVLQHEKKHITRKDNLWRLLGTVAVCVHWFNPFAWMLLKTFYSDLELACDESLIVTFDEKERKEYAHALLECGEKELMMSSAFGGAPIRLRIERIVNFRRITGFAMSCFSLLIVVIIIALITNAG